MQRLTNLTAHLLLWLAWQPPRVAKWGLRLGLFMGFGFYKLAVWLVGRELVEELVLKGSK